MRIRNVKNAKQILESSKYYVKKDKNIKGNWKELFHNQNMINMEIGMGKGDFIINMAMKYPNINFIGVEMYESVLVRAVQKLEDLNLNNVLVICLDANMLEEYFDREVDTLYLNFSDPWPKKRHKKRRLTDRHFLEIYDNIFIGDAKIVQKTDNDTLFESSLLELNNYGYIFEEVYLDVWKSGIDNIRTEYENKFGNKGFTIKKIVAHKESSKKEKNLV